MRPDTKAKLLAGIAKARGWLDELIGARVFDVAELAQREKRSVRSTAMLLWVAFLAPALVQAIADNRLPHGIGPTRLSDLPTGSEQFRALGLQAPRWSVGGAHPNEAPRLPGRPPKTRHAPVETVSAQCRPVSAVRPFDRHEK